MNKPANHSKIKHVIHLTINGKHEYFSSAASLYDKYDAKSLGISKASLINHFCKCNSLGMDIEYSNDKCCIRRGIIQQRKID